MADICVVLAATTASAVLNCEGALPKLLQLLKRTAHADKLTQKCLTASAQVTLTHVPSLDEIKQVIDEVTTTLRMSAANFAAFSCTSFCLANLQM